MLSPTEMPVVPPTVRAPLWIRPPLCNVRLPLIEDAPSSRPSRSKKLTFLPDTTETAPVKLLEVLFRVMSLAVPAVIPVAPLTVNAPVWVSAPPVCMVRSPETDDAPRIRAFTSRRDTSSPDTETAPVKSLLSLSVMKSAPTEMPVVPPTVKTPL
ncbi:MAG: hypothetical protein BWY09_02807 [Candidatus Hydrogenedentes bacterium ADurb.Bin179]|nr:MAG: hypothetical protein BWY09_02807 [Candidatus Hydrogenedentes bacterium ADurb.Bin179]